MTPGSTKIVFVTGSFQDGDFTSVGADTECQNLATAAGLPGVYKAWLSESQMSAQPALSGDGFPTRCRRVRSHGRSRRRRFLAGLDRRDARRADLAFAARRSGLSATQCLDRDAVGWHRLGDLRIWRV